MLVPKHTKRVAKIHTSGSYPCYVCTKGFPNALLNDHHIIPRAFGGSDLPDNKKLLCPTCHQTLHRLAELILAKKVGRAKDFAQSVYKDPSMIAKILQLAKTAAEYEYKFNLNTPEFARSGSVKKVTLAIPIDDYHRLMLMAVEVKMQRSIPKMLTKVIHGVLNKRYAKMESSDEGWEEV